ncbi:MAG: PAS domain S-box protein [Desulfobulbaceae bacterium]|nr:MAG: PAS domain S-box protein [Desulfobulbaceae bacterium]
MMVIATVAIAVPFAVWLAVVLIGFRSESAALRRQFEVEQQEMLRQEVGRVAEYIRYQIRQTDKRTRKTVRDRVEEACRVATHIYGLNRGVKPDAEIGAMIREVLRELRFNDGRGYYFAFDLNGVGRLHADRPELEGRDMLAAKGATGEHVVADMLDLVRKHGEGYYSYTWSKPGEPQQIFRKIAYVRLFEPLGWVIGTGEYVDDVRADIQTEVLEHIAGLRFGQDGYFFGVVEGGLPLFTGGRVTRGGPSIWNQRDTSGVRITQEFHKAMRQPQGGFVRYHWQKLAGELPSPKLSYVMRIPEWQWIIGAGVYLDTVEGRIAGHRRSLLLQIGGQIAVSGGLLLLLMTAIFLWARRLADSIKRSLASFSRFFDRAASASATLPEADLEYQEFRDIAASANFMLQARLQAESRLRESEEKYRLLIENAGEAIYVVQGGRLQYLNARVLELSCYAMEELLHKPVIKFVHPEDRLTLLKQYRLRRLGRPGLSRLRFRIQPKSGDPRWVELNIVDIQWAGKPANLNFLLDITGQQLAEEERRKLEAQLIHSQKMEAVGTLAGGIAHDFNNILGSIIGYTEMAIDSCPAGSDLSGDLGEIRKAGMRARDLVKKILAFSRQDNSERIPVNLPLMVGEVIGLVRPTLPADIEIVQEVEPGIDRVLADPIQLHQVLVNLCTNAGQAMEAGGGRLTIALRCCDLSLEDLALQPRVKPGRFVQLSVSDTGEGIEPDLLKRIFEPYFTTKEPGKGTGLGLAIVHGIIKSHDGFVTCFSRPGEGSVFHVFLPVLSQADGEMAASGQPVIGGSERILFVDDEEALAQMAGTMLARLGYRVTVETDSLAASALFHDNPDAFDLVITDQSMPGLTGIDLAQSMLQRRPDLPIILCTGYSTQVSEESARAMGVSAFALKPLVKKDIARLIRQVLADAGR